MARRVLKGVVVSDRSDKTVHVEVERRFTHPLYRKTVRRKTKFAAHDPENTYRVGDAVSIIETRPFSKTKTWAVLGAEAAAPQKELKEGAAQ